MARRLMWKMAAAGAAAMAAVLSAGLVPAQAATAPGWRVSLTVGAPADVTWPQPLEGESFYPGMVATSRDDAWSLWHTCAGKSCSQVLEHWNGTTWSARRPAALQKLGSPLAVGASSASNVWVFGGTPGQWAYLRWNGHTWSHHSLPSWLITRDGAGDVFLTVAVFGRSNVWVFSDAGKVAGHYNGHRWIKMHLPSELSPVDIVSRSDFWAVGVLGRLMHWNGTSWRRLSIPASLAPSGMTLHPQEVSATGPHTVWVLADAVNSATKASRVVLVHWNGKTWRRVGVPASANNDATTSLTPDGHGGWWLLAQEGTQWVFLHRTDGHWKTVPVPIPHGIKLIGPVSLARVPGTTSVLAAGIAFPASSPGGQVGIIWRYRR